MTHRQKGDFISLLTQFKRDIQTDEKIDREHPFIFSKQAKKDMLCNVM
jgi:hypothetical protein